MIRGISVLLFNKVETGTDEFGHPVYEEIGETVDHVLVAPSTSTDVITSQDLTGKKAVYTLAIPKGDEHIWEDRKIMFFGQLWHSFGFVTEGIEDNIPLCWNKKVMVERYE